ncbi:MAG: SDR family NAD(P)-dependent oxidoreductase [Planctomycetaceae bacterium]
MSVADCSAGQCGEPVFCQTNFQPTIPKGEAMRLKDKVVIITGAAGGIGSEAVSVCVKEGARVLAADLKQEVVDQSIAKHGDRASGIAVDVSNSDSVKAMIDAAVERFGTLDVVINNAGIGVPKALLDEGLIANFELVTKVNQFGVLYGIVHGGKKLIELGKPGVIINTSSAYGTSAAELTFSYNVSKAAIDMMTKSAALEFGPHKIRVVAVAPGRVNTPILQPLKEMGLWDHIRREHMRNEFTEPVEIANVMAFLASDDANCINGSTVATEDGFLSFKYPLVK